LSGGWRMKACLAGSILTKPDLLLLDEPTNHLDLYAIEWLENFLSDEDSDFNPTMLIVTHDRTFLNNVCDELIMLKDKHLSYFSGRYNDFLEIKSQKRSMQ